MPFNIVWNCCRYAQKEPTWSGVLRWNGAVRTKAEKTEASKLCLQLFTYFNSLLSSRFPRADFRVADITMTSSHGGASPRLARGGKQPRRRFVVALIFWSIHASVCVFVDASVCVASTRASLTQPQDRTPPRSSCDYKTHLRSLHSAFRSSRA